MFELGNNDDANDHQKKPRTDLTETNHLPALVLVRIFPGTEEGSDILGQPDKEAHQDKSQCQRHSIGKGPYPKDDPCSPEDNNHKCGQPPAKIRNVMVGKKVKVDGSTQ